MQYVPSYLPLMIWISRPNRQNKMAQSKLTEEQQRVVFHPTGKHARVLAVAGSGKTTTMVSRIRHLVMKRNVDPAKIIVLMFNRLARKQFQDKLGELGIPASKQPRVHTFHSFAYQIISEAVERGYISGVFDLWIGDREELLRRWVHRAIQHLETQDQIPPDAIDVDDAIDAIGLWKGSLIPPDRAGHHGNRFLPLVYREFEKLRMQKSGLTYDDFVPMAIGILEVEHDISQRWCNVVDHVIVDEYQDVNYGQQRLIEFVAGQRADVMVVGDDDQTIYEWRGARPHYILSEFQRVFNNKPYIDYQLSHSFRFGPVVAECAQHMIAFNNKRISKPLIAHAVEKPTSIQVIVDSSEQRTDVNKQLAEQLVTLVRLTRDPSQVIVLGRMFSQLTGLESEFLVNKIPYRVVGRAPFFERREIRVLLDYLALALELDSVITDATKKLVLSVANTPNRKLNKTYLTRALDNVQMSGYSPRELLRFLGESPNSPFVYKQRQEITNFYELLERLHERITSEPGLLAGTLLTWLVQYVNYLQHFDDYYGVGESSEDRKRCVTLFCNYATRTGLDVVGFLRHIAELDTTRGVPEDQQIVLTTVFRTKGLEYDYVIIPSCEEGYMPYLSGEPNAIYDTQGIVDEPEASDVIENERRLFYVAITRARKGVLIGTSVPPTQGSQATSSPSLPSRFIAEMELDETTRVMRALQHLSVDPDARRNVIAAAKHLGGNRRLMENVITRYLPRLGEDALAREVQSIVASLPIKEFSYPFDYNTASEGRPAPGTAPAPQTAAQAPSWWDEEGLPF